MIEVLHKKRVHIGFFFVYIVYEKNVFLETGRRTE